QALKTLGKTSEEARSVAVRLVASKLIERDQRGLTSRLGEFSTTTKEEKKEKKQKKPGGGDGGSDEKPVVKKVTTYTPAFAQEVALLMKDNEKDATDLFEKAKGKIKDQDRSVIERVAFSEGYARRGDWSRARERAQKPGTSKERF